MCSAYQLSCRNQYQCLAEMIKTSVPLRFDDLRTTIFMGDPKCFKHLDNTTYANYDIKASGMLLEEWQNLQTSQPHEIRSRKLSSPS